MNKSPNPQIVPDSAWERRVPSDQPRPLMETVTIKCDRCGDNDVTLVLEWWCLVDAPFNEQWWIIETPETVDHNCRVCEPCWIERMEILSRAAEYESDVPPPWFDSSYAGERWSEED